VIKGIAETCLYAKNLDETAKFYEEVLGFEIFMKEENRHVFFNCGDDRLFLFNPDHTRKKLTDVDGQAVPLHGATGSIHVAFSVSENSYDQIKEHLKDHEVTIESEISWPNKSRSFYFRDPAGNSLEIITSEMWK